jgi:hypothetical protein
MIAAFKPDSYLSLTVETLRAAVDEVEGASVQVQLALLNVRGISELSGYSSDTVVKNAVDAMKAVCNPASGALAAILSATRTLNDPAFDSAVHQWIITTCSKYDDKCNTRPALLAAGFGTYYTARYRNGFVPASDVLHFLGLDPYPGGCKDLKTEISRLLKLSLSCAHHEVAFCTSALRAMTLLATVTASEAAAHEVCSWIMKYCDDVLARRHSPTVIGLFPVGVVWLFSALRSLLSVHQVQIDGVKAITKLLQLERWQLPAESNMALREWFHVAIAEGVLDHDQTFAFLKIVSDRKLPVQQLCVKVSAVTTCCSFL